MLRARSSRTLPALLELTFRSIEQSTVFMIATEGFQGKDK